ncbi:MAG: hypothetical protein DRJ52_09620 [Thermoprotei archaeon]|nr:MAG: hypothetical protein DRJ52_09620 [Thermoprotei archaeon]
MIIGVTSGIRGGLGKSVISVALNFLLNIEQSSILLDIGGGSSKMVLRKTPEPPTLSDWIKGEALENSVRTILYETKKEKIPLYLLPETRELSTKELVLLQEKIRVFEDYGLKYTILDFPAISSENYRKLIRCLDLQLLVLVPETVPILDVLSTSVFDVPTVVVVNKFKKKIHRRGLEFIKKIFSDREVHVIPYDGALRAMSEYGIACIDYIGKDTESALFDLALSIMKRKESVVI